MQWTGQGCDVCGFGSVEDVEKFDPFKPCPECGEVAIKCNECEGVLGDAAIRHRVLPLVFCSRDCGDQYMHGK